MDVDGNPDPMVLDLEPVHTLPPLVQVRQWAASALAELGDDHIHAVLLVATELVTNAYEHGGSPTRIRLDHNRTPCWVRVEVDDPVETVPVVGSSRLGANRGRGLIIVDKLSVEWGVRSLDHGKTVWAQICCGEDPDGIPSCPDRTG
jgi:anti-sigma regulatory factor (Ser/Thr protein kinase)